MGGQPDEAYREYVQAHLPGLQRLAVLLCQDRDRAQDLVQEALVKLYLRWDRVRGASDPGAYGRTVLVRVFLSERRSSWARRVVLVDQVPEPPDGRIDAASMLTLRAALAALPPRQRAVMTLRFYADLSVDETAETLGCAAGTVKSQTAKALTSLRRSFPETTPPFAPSPRTRS